MRERRRKERRVGGRKMGNGAVVCLKKSQIQTFG